MNILLTGAFGNIGRCALAELLARGHRLRCFDIRTRDNIKHAESLGDSIEVVWGDLRNLPDVQRAVEGQDVVVHLAFVIPRLSATGVSSEEDPAWAKEVNVGGTKNILKTMQERTPNGKLIFTSSLHIYGRTQDQAPPRRIEDTPKPIEHYAKHKVICEELVRESGLSWAILRLGAALPMRLIVDPGMFDVPLQNRIEFVHREDVARAFANAVESDEVWGRVWHVGGGDGCQLYQRELVEGVLDAVGIGMLPEEAFATIPYPTDWLDTTESQRVLQFQRKTFKDYLHELSDKLGGWRYLFLALGPLIRLWLLSKSPRWESRQL
jgi:nucleoside-diphosphate-sugar epimerase